MVQALTEEGWLPEVRVRLEELLQSQATRGLRDVAVFDWDNTSMRGDIGDLVLAWMLRRDAVLQPPARDWSAFGALTPEALAELARTCDALAEPGQPLATSTHPDCARTLAHLAWKGTTTSGAEAFERRLYPTLKSTYAFMAQLLAGHTTDAARALASDALDEALNQDVGRRVEVGGVALDGYARLLPPIIELARALESVGVDVWIVSASAQPLVEVAAARAGFDTQRVIGARTQHDGVRHTPGLEPFGVIDGPPVTTFHEGKRAWINRVVYGHSDERALLPGPELGTRPILALGDSDTDLAMLRDAQHRVLFDRHEVRVSCAALQDPDSWWVQPLFVAPMPPRMQAPPCDTFVDELGPVRRA